MMHENFNHDNLLFFFKLLAYDNPNLKICDDTLTKDGKIEFSHVTICNKIASETLHFFFDAKGNPVTL